MHKHTIHIISAKWLFVNTKTFELKPLDACMMWYDRKVVTTTHTNTHTFTQTNYIAAIYAWVKQFYI